MLEEIAPPSVGRALARGLSRRCPRCGKGALFEGFYRLEAACGGCGFGLEQDVEAHIGLMYLTTAIQTALFAAVVLTVSPQSAWLARTALALVALAVMIGNMPNRKGFAIAVNYLVDRPGSDEASA